MKPGRVLLLVIGSLVALLGVASLASGAVLGLALVTQRDDAGYFATSDERFETAGYALTSDKIDLGDPGPDEWYTDQDLVTVRLRADNAGTGDIFVGIGPESDVEAYLAGVPHDDIVDVAFNPFSADYRRENGDGSSRPDRPADRGFWVAQASGDATQTITWDLEPGRWAIVVMNADGSRGVRADLELGGRIDFLTPIALGLGAAGIVVLVIGTVMIIAGAVAGGKPAVGRAHAEVEPGSPAGEVSTRAHPLSIEGDLDANLSRWRWMIKWLLAIPHFIVLGFLWVAFAVLTVVAFFGILFTGRYPRAIFDFNVGVLRWSWRVGYYAVSPLGTDAYPPFTLDPAEYPAGLDIVYPEGLSRGLVLIKSWLLALPHLLIVGVLTMTWSSDGDDRGGGIFLNRGLLGLLVLIAAVILLMTGRYPRGLYNLIMGINRWIFRVIVYVALMTDRYPPFRLDQGDHEPSSTDPQQLPVVSGEV